MTNVLFMMADELSWWALNAPVQMPNLHRLRARSMDFQAAYTPSPICVPTRAAIACGKDVHEIGYWSSAEPYDGVVPSWGHALQQAGIEPVSIGKLHYRSAEDDTGFTQQIEPVHVVDGVGWVQALLRNPNAPFTTTQSLARDIGPGDSDYIQYDRRVTAATLSWLAEPQRKTTPWCAFVSWLAPHFPLIAPPEDYALYDPKAYEGEAEIAPDHPVLQEIANYFDHDPHFTPETRGVARAAYYGLCTFLDRQIGQVLDTLSANGMDEDTLVIFTSDHGEMLGEKGFWTKSTMYDSAARVPLLMAGPMIDPQVVNSPVGLIDIAPTICAAMGAPLDGFSGLDLRTPDPARVVLSEYHDGGAICGITMVRWGRWKLVHYAQGYAPQLFDMLEDPIEIADLALARPEIVAEGMERLHKIMDPEEVSTRAFADQARRVAALGGAEEILKKEMFDYTPADSR